MTLLVIGGYATSGKDSVANFLVDELGWYKTYMSKPLENALLTLDPWAPWQGADVKGAYWIRYSELHARVGYDESKKNPEVRRLLQTLGTEIGRNMFGEDTWLDLVYQEVLDQLLDDRNVVVTGVRYPNEMAKFRKMNAQALWVSRPGVDPVNTHSSDNTLTRDDFDFLYANTSTLEELKSWTVSYFKER